MGNADSPKLDAEARAVQPTNATSSDVVAARRRFIKAGAAIVPLVLTMRATPAHAAGRRPSRWYS
jgi:hypothetical protein